MNQFIKKTLLLIMAFFAVCILPSSVYAAGKIDVNKDVNLTISYQNDHTAIFDALFEIYRVADVDEVANYTLTKDFKDYPIDIENLDEDGWNDLAFTLKGYALRDQITPQVSEKTDADGKLTVALKPGLYLVVGSRKTIGDYTYSAVPFIVALPKTNSANAWDYQVTAMPKSSRETNPSDLPDDKYITRKVLKIWDDKDYENKRPNSVTVQLLCDGKIYDTVTLNKDNNWRWAWDGLERDHDWLIVEKDVSGYTTKVSQEGITFTIVNSYHPDIPEIPDKPTDPELPNTGQLWWPVLPLIAIGLVCVIIGLVVRGKESA